MNQPLNRPVNKQRPTVWLLSAYRSASHAAWADWLSSSFTHINWHSLQLPGRHFRWRIRGNPLSWLDKLPKQQPDLILATSMVDLATLKGLHPRIASTPCIYYFHENQFAYPTSSQQHESIDPQMVQLYGAIAASKIVFNSAFNRDSFLSGVDQLLKKLPDQVPGNLPNKLAAKSHLLAVPIKPITRINSIKKNSKLILWNHRWEYDKHPQLFVDALCQLKEKNIDFQLALLGERAARQPVVLSTIEQQFSDRIIVNEKVEKTEYHKLLQQSSIVVSTAIHEFQGLSIMEAVSAGCTPVVPDNLCYPEQYAKDYRYTPLNVDALADKLIQFLDTLPETPSVTDWYENNLYPAWQQLLNTQ